MKSKDKSLFEDPGKAWEPYLPGPGAPWDARRVAHLHRRAGLGATWGQLRRDLAEGFEPSLGRVLEGEPQGPGGQPASVFAETVAAMEESAARRPSIERAQLLWLYRLIFTPHPLAEVMTLAWHSHYATSQAKVNSPELMLQQNQTFRRLWRAPIRQLHEAILADGAMLRWLDALGSTKAHPNENLAREFLELFALGEGNYTERDVREVARALTGWLEVDSQRKRDEFDPGDHDDGTKTILGETGKWGRNDLVRIACRQPAAATHVARRLYRTFICDTDDPSPELLAPLAAAMRTGGDVDVGRGIEFLLRSRLFHGEECRAKRVKSPVVLAVGAIRASELLSPPPDLVELEIFLNRMGQRLFYPPNVAGWPPGLSWLRGPTILARANFAAWLIGPSSGAAADQFDALAMRHGLQAGEAWAGALAALLCGPEFSRQRTAELLAECRCEPGSPRLSGRVFSRLLSSPEAQLG
jgi:uncharacterized protein (DUF1800 family)